MAGKRCFSVHCHSQGQCLWMPAKDNKYMLQLSYIASAHSLPVSGKSPLMPRTKYKCLLLYTSGVFSFVQNCEKTSLVTL